VSDSLPPSRGPSPSSHDTLTLRALVSTKDAGIIIGKAGKNVADLREQTAVKAGVSKVIPGVHERVLTVSGPVESVAQVSRHFFYMFVLLNNFSGIHSHYFATSCFKPPLSRYRFFVVPLPHIHSTSYFPQSHGDYNWS
jgi:hypothetical protein